jgi:hypothetical protein
MKICLLRSFPNITQGADTNAIESPCRPPCRSQFEQLIHQPAMKMVMELVACPAATACSCHEDADAQPFHPTARVEHKMVACGLTCRLSVVRKDIAICRSTQKGKKLCTWLQCSPLEPGVPRSRPSHTDEQRGAILDRNYWEKS